MEAFLGPEKRSALAASKVGRRLWVALLEFLRPIKVSDACEDNFHGRSRRLTLHFPPSGSGRRIIPTNLLFQAHPPSKHTQRISTSPSRYRQLSENIYQIASKSPNPTSLSALTSVKHNLTLHFTPNSHTVSTDSSPPPICLLRRSSLQMWLQRQRRHTFHT